MGEGRERWGNLGGAWGGEGEREWRVIMEMEMESEGRVWDNISRRRV